MTDSVDRLASALADRYRIERELGAGGMATVYLAHDLKHERDVAIKVLHQDLAAALGAERFLAEIKTTARLQHPHILPLLDSGSADGLLYYVMPHVKGESLRDRLYREKQLPIDDAVRIAREVADALGHAHQQGIIHRDIKPENILLQEGHALVADFGIALAVQSAGGQRMTQTGLSLGTPQYMSPEQAMGEKAIDARSDIYALGAVTYEMLTGEPPFTGATVQAIVARVLSEQPRAVSGVRRSVPLHVEAAVLAALEKLPADRLATAGEFASALVNPQSGALRAQTQQTRRPSQRRTALIAAAAVVLVGSGWIARSMMQQPQAAGRGTTRLSVNMPPGVTLTTGEVPRLAISRDGRWLAYCTNRGIELRALDSYSSRVIEVAGEAWGVFFSPDGQWLAYLTSFGVWKVPVAGGSPVQLSKAWVYHATWGDDGNIYFSADVGASGLFVMTGEATQPRQLTRPDSSRGEAFHLSPEFLPGGKLLFTATGPTGGWAQAKTMVIDVANPSSARVVLEGASSARFIAPDRLTYLDASGRVVVRGFDASRAEVSGEPVAIDSVRTTHFGAVAYIVASREGTIAFIPGSERGKQVIVERDASGKQLRQLFSGYPGWPSLSPDGRTFAYGDWSGRDAQIFTMDLATGTESRRTFAATENEGTIFSADSKKFLYTRQALGGRRELLVGTTEAQGEGKVLFSRRFHMHVHAWSPDGRWVVFNQFEGTRSNLYLVDLNKPDSTRLIAENSDYADLTRDGRSLAYCARENERGRVYIVSFPDLGSRSHVASRDACWPRFSRDGRTLWFSDLVDWGRLGSMYSVQRATADGRSWSAPQRLFDAWAGPFVVSENPTRFIKIETDSSHLAREIRIVTGWHP